MQPPLLNGSMVLRQMPALQQQSGISLTLLRRS